MAFLNVKNRAASTLAADISDTDTSLTVASGEGTKFPSAPFHITVEDEIMEVTAVNTDTFTVTRGVEDTTAAAHSAGVRVELRITAKIIQELQTTIDNYLDQAVKTTSSPTFAGLTLSDTPLGVSSGGTGLSSIAADNIIYTSADNTFSATPITAFGRSLIDDADAATARTTLGLGSIATQDANNVNITGGSISGITDLAIADGGTGASTAADARSNLGLGSGDSPTFAGLTVDTDTLYVDATNHRVGIGTNSPGYLLHIKRSTGDSTVFIDAQAGEEAVIRFGYGGDEKYWSITTNFRSNDDYGFRIWSYDTSTWKERFFIDRNYGNVGIGGAKNFGTNAQGVLGIKNGTAPTSSPADMVQLYAEDVSSSSELKVRDEAGNVTTLSPHNFTLFKPKKDYFLPWSYYSKNDYLGREINVDMYGAIKAVEELTGKKFIYTREFKPTKDWDEEQEKIYQEREEEIKRLKAENERLKKENKKLKEKQPLSEIPKKYKKKPIPEWMVIVKGRKSTK